MTKWLRLFDYIYSKRGKAMTNLDGVLQKQRHHFDHKQDWAPKNWCFRTVVLENTLESPLYIKEIKSVNPKGNQLWTFIGRTDAEVESPILWSLDEKSRLTGKDLYAGKDWGQREKGATENKMVGWHHRLNGNAFEPTPGDSEGQGSLVCCSGWGCRIGHNLVTEQQQQ